MIRCLISEPLSSRGKIKINGFVKSPI